MGGSQCGRPVLPALILAFSAGCGEPDRQFDLLSFNPSLDQRRIARYYHEESVRYLRQAEELDARAEMYERVFGPSSDWVSGARLLAQSYRYEAEQRKRAAREHLGVGEDAEHDRSSLRSFGAKLSPERTP